jgi:hypothetical protein
MKIVTIKLNIPEFDRESIKYIDMIFGHISEELAMFEKPTQFPLYRDKRKVGMVKVKEKMKKLSKGSEDESGQQTLTLS